VATPNAIDWPEELEARERAVAESPGDLDARRARVNASLHAGELNELARRLEAAHREDPTDGFVLFELALAVAAVGEPGSDGRAIELLGQAQTLLPDHHAIGHRVGLLHLQQEDFDAAERALSRALEIAPRSVPVRVALAATLLELDDHERARELLSSVPDLELDQGDLDRARMVAARLTSPWAHVPRAIHPVYQDALASMSESDAPGEVFQIVEQALVDAPDCAPLLTLRGLASLRIGRLAQARHSLERAVELWPGDPIPHLELAAISVETGDLGEAEGHLDGAVAANPLSQDAWAELGRVRYQRRDYESAIRAFRRLVAIGPESSIGQLWLGRSLRRAGRDDEAEQWYLRLLGETPGSFEAAAQLGHIYRRRRLTEADPARAEELAEQARHYYQLAQRVNPRDPMVERMLRSLEP